MKYRIKMWYGTPEDGILIARPIVEATCQQQAIQKFIIPCIRLIDADWEEISIRVELFSGGH